MQISDGAPRRQHASVIPANLPRIEREPNAPGWLVIHRSYGWAYGSRFEALLAARELAREVRS